VWYWAQNAVQRTDMGFFSESQESGIVHGPWTWGDAWIRKEASTRRHQVAIGCSAVILPCMRKIWSHLQGRLNAVYLILGQERAEETQRYMYTTRLSPRGPKGLTTPFVSSLRPQI